MNSSFPSELIPAPIQKFIEKMRNHTEAPDEYLCAGGLFIASVLAGRWYSFNGQKLNGYYLLVGETGTARKTSAQTVTHRLLERVLKSRTNLINEVPANEETKLPTMGPSHAYPVVTHFTIEGLQAHAIGDGTSTGILMGEYGSLFEVGKRQGQQNTISEITNLYDGNPVYVRNVGRTSDARNYSLSIMAGSTPSWLEEFGSEKNISGGFVNRHLIFCGAPERLLPSPKEPSEEEWQGLVDLFAAVIPGFLKSSVLGEKVVWSAPTVAVEWEPSAREAWEDYYKTWTVKHRSSPDGRTASLAARELPHANKLMALRCILEGRSAVSLEDFHFGIALATWSVQNAAQFCVAKEGHPIFQDKLVARIFDKIAKSESGITKTELARTFGGKQNSVNGALGALIALGFVESDPLSLAGYRVPPNHLGSKSKKSTSKSDHYPLNQSWEVGRGV